VEKILIKCTVMWC